jgi:hypothetical protein
LRALVRKYFSNSSSILPRRAAGRGPAKSFYNSSTILLLFLLVWKNLVNPDWIGLEKNCRRNNRKRIVETFGECRSLGDPKLALYVFCNFFGYQCPNWLGVTRNEAERILTKYENHKEMHLKSHVAFLQSLDVWLRMKNVCLE